MHNFNELDLPQKLQDALESMAFSTPTPIQAQTIPAALEGKDVLGTAQTGTGKTGAFGIPLAAKLMNDPQESVIVLTPTRELALQVITFFHQLLKFDKSIKTALLIGGDSMGKQLQQLKRNPRVIVGTPGRINDHLKRNTLKLGNTRSLVLDESDLMLDMGFDVQIETIINRMPKEGRQTLMFSATLPRKIEAMASRYLKNPLRVSVGQQSEPGKNIKQESLVIQEADKYDQLLTQLNEREGSVIIFVKTKRGADKLSLRLNKEDHKAGAIHGDLRQSKRERMLGAFRKQKYRIMVATDVAARGIDVPHIRHVINYDLPQCPEDYIHRIGRTARGGETGSALSFVTRQDRSKWHAIERLLDPNAKPDRNGGGRASYGPKRKPRSGGFFKGKGQGGGGFRKRSSEGQGERSNQGFRGKPSGGQGSGGFRKRSSEGQGERSNQGFRGRSSGGQGGGGFRKRSSEGQGFKGKPQGQGGSRDGGQPRFKKSTRFNKGKRKPNQRPSA